MIAYILEPVPRGQWFVEHGGKRHYWRKHDDDSLSEFIDRMQGVDDLYTRLADSCWRFYLLTPFKGVQHVSSFLTLDEKDGEHKLDDLLVEKARSLVENYLRERYGEVQYGDRAVAQLEVGGLWHRHRETLAAREAEREAAKQQQITAALSQSGESLVVASDTREEARILAADTRQKSAELSASIDSVERQAETAVAAMDDLSSSVADVEAKVNHHTTALNDHCDHLENQTVEIDKIWQKVGRPETAEHFREHLIGMYMRSSRTLEEATEKYEATCAYLEERRAEVEQMLGGENVSDK